MEGKGMSKVGEKAGEVGRWQNTEGLRADPTGSHSRLLLRGMTRMRLFKGETRGDGQESLGRRPFAAASTVPEGHTEADGGGHWQGWPV